MAAYAEEPVLCCLLTAAPLVRLCRAGVFRHALLNLGRNQRRTYKKKIQSKGLYIKKI